MHGEPDHGTVPAARTEPPSRMLFCPFCRDGFEGVAECPEHELTLVPIDRLPRMAGRTSDVTHFVDPRFGRGPVMLGAAFVIIGFFLPFVRAESIEASALQVAVDGARNLWLTPGAALVMLGVLWVRRKVTAMRSARLAVLGLSFAGALPLLYSARRISIMAEARQTDVDWLLGCVVMVTGLAVAGFGSFGFGARRR
jgi:hypothetical protein